MKHKLDRIYNPWRRLAITLLINTLLQISKLQSARARAHWVGAAKRPRRLERPLFFVVLFLPVLLLELNQYLIWAVVWGGAASFFLITHTINNFVPRKACHRIGDR